MFCLEERYILPTGHVLGNMWLNLCLWRQKSEDPICHEWNTTLRLKWQFSWSRLQSHLITIICFWLLVSHWVSEYGMRDVQGIWGVSYTIVYTFLKYNFKILKYNKLSYLPRLLQSKGWDVKESIINIMMWNPPMFTLYRAAIEIHIDTPHPPLTLLFCTI